MSHHTHNDTSVELATFYIGNALCGMNILQIQEINKIMKRTPVPQSPSYVQGVLNLRGQIVTIIDLGKKLGLGDTELTADTRNIIVRSNDGITGLLVKKIRDVVELQTNGREKPPANMKGIQGKFFSGVFKTEKFLIGELDIATVLSSEE